MLVGGGLSKTWNPFLDTYSALSSGSSTGYLPELRIDHSFNFKLGQKRNNVLPIALTYISSHTGHQDYVVSSGIVAYRSNWVYEYKISRNQSEPGGAISYSNLLSVSHGQEGVQWLSLTMSAGKQAYLATNLTIPEKVNHDSFYADIHFRHWLAKNYGITGDLSYLKLDRGYNKYGISLGVFTEF
jgi:YaiO family outer membrane protein